MNSVDDRKLAAYARGSGRVERGDPPRQTTGWRLHLDPTREYADAQLDDCRQARRSRFPWRPPVRLSLSARASGPSPLGTFGFGFWNDPFTLPFGVGGAQRRLPATPQTAWFFRASEPADLALQAGVPGHGWKAATLCSAQIPSPLLMPLAAGAALLAAAPGLRSLVFRLARRFYTADETVLRFDPSQWHSYAVDWRADRVIFQMDGEIVAVSAQPPHPPLGLVIWIDNQFAVASPERGFSFGVLPLEEAQWLEVADLRVRAA